MQILYFFVPNIVTINLLIKNWCDMRAKDKYGNYFLQYIGKNHEYNNWYFHLKKKYITVLKKINFEDVKESLHMRYMLKNLCIFYIKQNIGLFDKKVLMGLNRDLRIFF